MCKYVVYIFWWVKWRFRIPNKDANKKPSGGASPPAAVASQTGVGDARIVSIFILFDSISDIIHGFSRISDSTVWFMQLDPDGEIENSGR